MSVFSRLAHCCFLVGDDEADDAAVHDQEKIDTDSSSIQGGN